MNKVKVISDGTPQGTYVIDLDTNKPIDNIVDLALYINAEGSEVRFTISVLNPVIDIEGKISEIERIDLDDYLLT